MNFSKKILNRTKVYPQTIRSAVKNRYKHHFEVFEVDVEVLFNVDNDILIIDGLKGDLHSPYDLILDGLLELVDGQKVGSLNRVSSKELDYFFRDEKQIPSVSFYGPEYLDLFSLTSGLYQSITGIESMSLAPDPEFFQRSFSEQIEYFEEILAEAFYPYKEWSDISLDLEEVSGTKIFLRSENELIQIQQDELRKKLIDYLPEDTQIELLIDF